MSGLEEIFIGGFDYRHLISIGFVLAGGSFIQSAVGFGYGLWAFPLLLFLTDLPVPGVIALMGSSGFIQSSVSAYHHRKYVVWKKLFPFIIIGIISLQVGIWTLHSLQGLDRSTIKQMTGAILLSILIIQYIFSVQPREKVHPFWGVIALFLFGYISGIDAMGGPFAVLWVMAHQWSNRQMRGSIIAIIVCVIPFQVFLLVSQFGPVALNAAVLGLLFMPMALLGTFAGLWIGDRIPKKRLRRLAVGLLFIIAATAILHPLFQ